MFKNVASVRQRKNVESSTGATTRRIHDFCDRLVSKVVEGIVYDIAQTELPCAPLQWLSGTRHQALHLHCDLLL